MPFVTVEWSPRSVEAKREVAKAITEVICKVTGNKPETVRIGFIEEPPDCVAFGGVLFSDQKK